MKKLLSVLIPVYNEEKTITKVINKVLAVKIPNIKKELIIVNDGSIDKTKINLKNISHKKQIKIYHHIKNKGKGAAIQTCIKKAQGDIMIIQDGDMELDPNDYPKILNPILKNKAQVVYGSRFKNLHTQVPIVTFWGNKLLTTITNILFFTNLTDMSTAYKAFTKNVIKKIKLTTRGFTIDAELTANFCKNKINIIEVPINYHPRSSQQGKKIRNHHALSIIFTLIKMRFFK